jgi:hypothetical protein
LFVIFWNVAVLQLTMAKAWLRLADYVELRQRERLSQHRQDLPQTNSPVRKDQRG